MKKAIIYTLAFAAISILVPSLIGQILGLLKDSESSAVLSDSTTLIIAMAAANVTVMAVFLVLRWVRVSRSYVRSRPWDVLIWCAVAAFGTVIPSSAFQEMIPELPNFVEQQFDSILRNRWGYFAVGLLAPVAEELVFRGAVLRSLLDSRLSPLAAVALSSLLFALIHANPAQMPHAFLVGLLLGWFYYRTGSVVPGIVFHWVNNSIAYVVYNLYPDPSLKLIDLFGSQRHVAAAVLFSLFILLPAFYQLHLRMKKA